MMATTAHPDTVSTQPPEILDASTQPTAPRFDVAEALANVDDLREKLGRDAAPAILRELERVQATLKSAQDGTFDLSAFRRPCAPAERVAFPAAAESLAHDAIRRLARSKFMFPNPHGLLTNLLHLACDGLSEADIREFAARVFYAISKASTVTNRDGFIASSMLVRLNSAAVAASRCDPSLPIVGQARLSIAAFLEDARRG